MVFATYSVVFDSHRLIISAYWMYNLQFGANFLFLDADIRATDVFMQLLI